MRQLRVLSTLALAGVMQELTPRFEQDYGIRVESMFSPTALLVEQIAAGAVADVAILTAEAIEALIAESRVRPDSRVDLARSSVGVAVREGAPHPRIGTKAEFVATMLDARSVALSKAGASGIFMAGLLQRLGIAEAIAAKATVIPGGFTAELVARGEAEIAIQQISELMVVKGVEIVGKLPAEIAGITDFTAGIFAGSAEPAAASLIAMLAAPEMAALYRQKGLEQLQSAGAPA